MSATFCKPGDVRYTACWRPGNDEVTIIRDLYAGISGPIGFRAAHSREEAARMLFEAGFLTGDDWKVRLGAHWVTLTPMT